MAGVSAVWGIEIGQRALRAMKLRPTADGKVELLAFDVIEHPKILSQPDAEPEELMRAALEKFTSRNDWQGDKFVIGVPGHQTFARFCKLPPVDEKKIPDIVRFEASQQIPFKIEDVVWDYQVFKAADMPDVEVGIFAMRKDLIRRHLDRYAAVGITPMIIQTIPQALYNFARFERLGGLDEGVATVVVDVGAQHTDLVIIEKNGAWTRNIPLGGNNFTETLVKAFKLPFAKAEALKCTAATSKVARRVFQEMRPVFADLVAEIQRSLGFYASTHREIKLERVIACGAAFRLTGLQKYLETNLSIEGGVQRLESFRNLIPTAASNAPQFTESIACLAPAYGLALQGLGLGEINANLLPPELARIAMWNRKRPMFVAAAACVGLAAAFPWLRSSMDASALAASRDEADRALAIVNRVQQLQAEFREVQTDTSGRAAQVEKLFELFSKRDLVPRIVAFVHETLPPLDPAVAAARTPEELKRLVESDPARFKRTSRRQIFIESLDIDYAPNIDAYTPQQRASGPLPGIDQEGFGGSQSEDVVIAGLGGRRQAPPPAPRPAAPPPPDDGAAAPSEAGAGFYVSISGYLTYGESQVEASRLLTNELIPAILRLGNIPGRGFYVPENDPANPSGRNLPVLPTVGPRFDRGLGVAQVRIGAPPPGGPATPGDQKPAVLYPDPVTGEDMITDWHFRIGFKVKLGEPPQSAPQEQPAPPQQGG